MGRTIRDRVFRDRITPDLIIRDRTDRIFPVRTIADIIVMVFIR